MITIIEDERNKQSKQLIVGSEEIARMIDFSQDSSFPHHYFGWQTESTLNQAITIITILGEEVKRYTLPVTEKAFTKFSRPQSPNGIITLGETTSCLRQRKYSLEEFLGNEVFSAQVGEKDVCLGITTPYFSMFFMNEPLKLETTDNSEQVVFEMGVSGGKMQGYRAVHDGTLHDKINSAQFTTNYNCATLLSKVILTTLPPNLKEKIIPTELEENLSELLKSYRKPVLLQGAN